MKTIDKSGLKVSLLILCSIMFAISMVAFGSALNINESASSINCDSNKHTLKYCDWFATKYGGLTYQEQYQYDKVLNLAYENTIGKTFKLHKYDCTDYSKDLVSKLNKAGIKARCSAGTYIYGINPATGKPYTDHTWVSAWIGNKRIELESTQGYEIPQDIYKSDYKLKWENLCW